MGSILTVFTKNGDYLDTLTSGTATTRGYCLNDFERCEWEMSTSDVHFNERNVRVGNLVWVQHIPSLDVSGNSQGQLPDWYGVILPPYFWNEAAGSYKVTAYSLEYILRYRPMPFVSVEGTQGHIFRKMLSYANNTRGVVIQPGDIDDDKAIIPMNLSLSMYDHLKDLTQAARVDWDVTGDVDATGHMTLYANLYNRKGSFTGQTLRAGLNLKLKDQLLTAQGEIVNHVLGYGASFTPGLKPSGNVRDDESISLYGEWAKNIVFSSQSGNIAQAAKVSLSQSKDPQIIFNPIALDVGMTFSYLSPGNTWNVALGDVGFVSDVAGTARILSMKPDDLTNETDLQVSLTL